MSWGVDCELVFNQLKSIETCECNIKILEYAAFKLNVNGENIVSKTQRLLEATGEQNEKLGKLL